MILLAVKFSAKYSKLQYVLRFEFYGIWMRSFSKSDKNNLKKHFIQNNTRRIEVKKKILTRT